MKGGPPRHKSQEKVRLVQAVVDSAVVHNIRRFAVAIWSKLCGRRSNTVVDVVIAGQVFKESQDCEVHRTRLGLEAWYTSSDYYLR